MADKGGQQRENIRKCNVCQALMEAGLDEETAVAYHTGEITSDDLGARYREIALEALGEDDEDDDVRPRVGRRIRRARGPGKGWHKQPRRHARAARKGHARKRRR